MRKLIMLAVAVMALAIVPGVASAAPPSEPLPGAVFTTDVDCNKVNGNIYPSKDAVFVDGGPQTGGNPNNPPASLPDGSYYVQVTNPGGDVVLGSSVNLTNQTPYVVVNGQVDCLKLADIVGQPGGVAGYTDTPNPGGEYKVWISTSSSFVENSTKTDNFKVKDEVPPPPADEKPVLDVEKYYDANVNGVQDQNEPNLFWRIHITGGSAENDVEFTPFHSEVDPGMYTVTEDNADSPPTWLPTTPTSVGPFELALNGGTKHVEFGNVCLGKGGGLTLGFWSNKNGQALIDSADLTALRTLNLRNANGSDFDPTTAAQVKTFLLGGNAVNMANMLSVQLTAMELNVLNGKVSSSAIISTGSGFQSIADLMTAANAELIAHPNTTAAGADRTNQESLKNLLDDANNDKSIFVQSNPCTYTFDGLAPPALAPIA